MLRRNTKECVGSENSCSKYFVNFQEIHPREMAFLNKVAGYLTLTGNALLGNLWNFQNRFHKKHSAMLVSASSCHWKMFRPKYAFKKTSHLIWYSVACAPRDYVYTRSLKTFNDVYPGFYLVCSVHFSLCFIHLDKWQRHKHIYLDKWQCHEHCVDYIYSYFFYTRSFKEVGSAW